MKKILFAATAAIAIAACSKNEAVRVDGPQEIAYQTVINPATKALGANQVAFSKTNKFKSFAYLVTGGTTWDAATSKIAYISDALISYNTDKWSAQTSYFWPKDAGSSLTFFAWTDNTANPAVDGVTCDAENGIKFTGYDVTASLNKDLMVADIAKDKTENENTYETDGVPTLFRHKLSSVNFTVKQNDTYAGAEITLTKVAVKHAVKTANYTQLGTEGWTALTTDNLAAFTGTQAVTTTAVAVASQQTIFIPEAPFTNDDLIEITYTIKTNYTGTPVTETVTIEKKLSELFADGFVMGKRYTVNIAIALNEILWDPAIQDWDDVAGANAGV